MVNPGATTKKPFVKLLLFGLRTLLMVCQAISIAMTVVLPAPVASFNAKRIKSGLERLLAFVKCSVNPSPRLPICGATSINQMAVSTASS